MVGCNGGRSATASGFSKTTSVSFKKTSWIFFSPFFILKANRKKRLRFTTQTPGPGFCPADFQLEP
jgi:uncharacterized membrane protein